MLVQYNQASLGMLPAELISRIAHFLELIDVRALRLSSRNLAISSFGAVKVQTRRQRVVLRPESIRRVLKNLLIDGPVQYMQELVLVGEPLEDPLRTLKLLGTMLSAARTKSNLHSIDIETTRDGLTLILLALQASKIPLTRLRIYPNGGRLTTSMDAYCAGNLQALAPCLQLVKEFSWSLTATSQREEYWPENSTTSSIQNVDMVNRILSMARATEKLDLLWYKSGTGHNPEAYFFEKCYESVLAMTRLQDCSLRGLYVTELTLLKFLQRTSASTINLAAIRLRPGGQWRAILNVVTSGKFYGFAFEDLYQYRTDTSEAGYAMIFFDVMRRSGFGARRFVGSSTVCRKVEGVRGHVEYHFGRGIDVTTPEALAHFIRLLETYGSD